MARALIVEDERHTRRFLAQVLSDLGHEVIEAATLGEGLQAVAAEQLDLVITDQRLPDGEGLDLLAAAARADPALPVVLLTAYASVDLAVQAMRQGAFDFVSKPFTAEQVEVVTRRAMERAHFAHENEALRVQLRLSHGPTELVGQSEAMARVWEQIDQVAPTAATVLIEGETGTGKELVAREVHRRSRRHEAAFLAINCAALPETLLESELFGHEKGAFTGADRTRKGLFEAAHGGTLLLDEAGEMPLSLQAKLLRVLAEGKIVRVGATNPRQVDVRILAATHRDLRQRTREGSFREDLYYRLAVFPLVVPPLRERRVDIPMLAEHFLQQAAAQLKVRRRHLSPGALEQLLAYDFPGNVRELRNLLERACIVARSETIETTDLPLNGVLDPAGGRAGSGWADTLPADVDLREAMAQLERVLLERALRQASGVQAEAARRLGISRSDMSYKVRKHKLLKS